MAEILKANCRSCNYQTKFQYGGSKLDYQTNNPVPAYNLQTENLESVNYKVEKDNPNYIFYSQNELKGDNEMKSTFRNFNLELNKVNNFCPNCKNYSLDFYLSILC